MDYEHGLSKGVGPGLLLLAAVLGLVVAVPPAQGQTETVKTSREKILQSFNGTDGSYPYATLVFDKEGNLYGTTYEGGAYGAGTVFELVKTHTTAYTEKVLYSFTGGADGGYPNDGATDGGWALVLDKSGNLYGTTAFGGACGGVEGTAFEVTPSGSETVLHSFCGGSDGYLVVSGLILDAKGNLYGTTWVGGLYDGGIVFELTPSGGTWTETVLWNLGNGADGAHSNTSLIMDTQGNLFGTTWWGGTYNLGTVFELTPSGGTWTETVLWNFGNGTDGGNPSNLILGAKGNLYGETGWGGTYSSGKVFELTPTANGWTETVLWNFGNGTDGQSPYGGLVFDTKKGKLYGTTVGGGTYGGGTVFELTPTKKGWTETVPWSFGNGTDGSGPWDGLVFDKQGNLYGTTMFGGAYGQGTVFKVTR